MVFIGRGPIFCPTIMVSVGIYTLGGEFSARSNITSILSIYYYCSFHYRLLLLHHMYGMRFILFFSCLSAVYMIARRSSICLNKVTLAFNIGDIACPHHLACCICKMYLCLGIGNLTASHRHGENHGRKIVHLSQK